MLRHPPSPPGSAPVGAEKATRVICQILKSKPSSWCSPNTGKRRRLGRSRALGLHLHRKMSRCEPVGGQRSMAARRHCNNNLRHRNLLVRPFVQWLSDIPRSPNTLQFHVHVILLRSRFPALCGTGLMSGDPGRVREPIPSSQRSTVRAIHVRPGVGSVTAQTTWTRRHRRSTAKQVR